MLHGLTASAMLDLWEQGQTCAPVEQALLLLSACTGVEADRLATLSLGQRDVLLLAARQLTFGADLSGFVSCPTCSTQLEFAMTVESLVPAAVVAATLGNLADAHRPQLCECEAGGTSVLMRMPNSADLLAIAACPDVSAARRLLYERCVVHARRGDEPIEVAVMNDDWVAQVAAVAHEHDPYAEILLALGCPECGSSQPVLLDVASFFWRELMAAARRLFREVHQLAHFYAWRECDILAMTAYRRRQYLELIEGS